jgi:hypothetical protein
MLRLAIRGRVSDVPRQRPGSSCYIGSSGMDCVAYYLCLLVLQLKVIEAVLGGGVSCSGERHLASGACQRVRPRRAAAGSRGQRNKKSIADADPRENWWAAL